MQEKGLHPAKRPSHFGKSVVYSPSDRKVLLRQVNNRIPFEKRELAGVISAMFCGCPVRGEQNGISILNYWGNDFIFPVKQAQSLSGSR
jgi:hypothetical protein